MTRKEYIKGWLLLVAQPWGTRYAGDTEIATVQAEFYFTQFSGFPVQAWWQACERFASAEHWPTVDEIRKALDGTAGRPGVEEAWSLIQQVMGNEQASIVWTDEMREAYGVAAPLADDLIAARMAFKEKYTALLAQSRTTRLPVKWCVSLGYDKNQRAEAVQEAARRNLISQEYATTLLPPSEADALALVAHVAPNLVSKQ